MGLIIQIQTIGDEFFQIYFRRSFWPAAIVPPAISPPGITAIIPPGTSFLARTSALARRPVSGISGLLFLCHMHLNLCGQPSPLQGHLPSGPQFDLRNIFPHDFIDQVRP